MVRPLDAIWQAALATRVPRASWSVREGTTVLAARAPERWFSSASMIKTFVLAVALEAAETGELELDAPVTVRCEHMAGGDGVLRLFATPPRLPLRELLRLMVVLSDNTATNAVLEALGGLEPLNERLAAQAYGSRMRGWAGNAGPRWSGAASCLPDDLLSPAGLGVTSLVEHARLMAEVHAGERLPVLGRFALDLLAQQADRRALARFLPEGASFAHKTGTIDRVRHDAGVLEAGGRTIWVGAFTDGGPEEEWVDHPACVGMGLAMTWTAQALGLALAIPPGTPPLPRELVPQGEVA